MPDPTRAIAIRRALRNLDALGLGHHSTTALEIELARAYDAGHVAGSGVRHQTDAEQHLAEVVRGLGCYQVALLDAHVGPELYDAVNAIRDEREPPRILDEEHL